MEFSNKKLWKLLIDREMQKKELCALAGISTATISKMTKGTLEWKEAINAANKEALKLIDTYDILDYSELHSATE